MWWLDFVDTYLFWAVMGLWIFVFLFAAVVVTREK